MISSKEIWQWKWGNNATHDEYITSRAFIFGNYDDSFEAYRELVKQAKRDFPKLKNSEITIGKVKNCDMRNNYICISFLVKSKCEKYPLHTERMGWTY